MGLVQGGTTDVGTAVAHKGWGWRAAHAPVTAVYMPQKKHDGFGPVSGFKQLPLGRRAQPHQLKADAQHSSRTYQATTS